MRSDATSAFRAAASRANRPREAFALKHRPPSADIRRVEQHLPNRHHPRQRHSRREAGPQSPRDFERKSAGSPKASREHATEMRGDHMGFKYRNGRKW